MAEALVLEGVRRLAIRPFDLGQKPGPRDVRISVQQTPRPAA